MARNNVTPINPVDRIGAEPVMLALSAAGISSKRQARYQRRMSSLLAGRE